MKETLLWLQLPDRKKPDGHCLYHSIKDIGQWIERTSILPVGEQSRLYYSFLVEVNALDIPLQKRLDLLEQLHPPILKLLHRLSKRCVGSGLPLNEEKNRLADLLGAFLIEMTTGYKIIIDELADMGLLGSLLKQKNLTLAIYFALYYSSLKLFYNYILYADHHVNEWLDIHQLYQFASKRHCEKRTVKNFAESVNTIAEIYKKILLFALSNPYHLSIGEMTLLWNKLDDWSHYTELNIPEKNKLPESHFLIRPYSESPPFSKQLLSLQRDEYVSSQLWGFETRNLCSFLNKNAPFQNVSDPFLKRLLKVWSVETKRQDERQAMIEPVDMVPGVTHVSHFLGSVTLETRIHELYDEQIASNSSDHHDTEIPVFRAFLVDESSHGFRLKLGQKNTQSFQPRINEIIAVKHRDGSIHVGYLRWLMENRENEIEMGIEHLSSMAESVQLVLTNHQDAAVNNNLLNTRILDSFVFPGGKAQHFRPILFTHSFIEKFAGSRNYVIKLIHKTGTINIRLIQKVDVVLDYNLYLFEKSEAIVKDKKQQEKTERFEGLWDKL